MFIIDPADINTISRTILRALFFSDIAFPSILFILK